MAETKPETVLVYCFFPHCYSSSDYIILLVLLSMIVKLICCISDEDGPRPLDLYHYIESQAFLDTVTRAYICLKNMFSNNFVKLFFKIHNFLRS